MVETVKANSKKAANSDTASETANVPEAKKSEAKTVAKKSALQAIVLIKGKQLVVKVGGFIDCEKIDQELGSDVEFTDVLCLMDGDKVDFGAPYLNKVVKAKVVAQERDKKIIIFKKIRRHGYQRKAGHRQNYTTLQITSIT